MKMVDDEMVQINMDGCMYGWMDRWMDGEMMTEEVERLLRGGLYTKLVQTDGDVTLATAAAA